MLKKVTPCVGVWIETIRIITSLVVFNVTPCVGVWIETVFRKTHWLYKVSHPAWVCGLKRPAT